MTVSLRRQFAVDVVHKLRDAGFEALWAGGCVRDYLLGREPKDFDVATNARPEKVREVFGRRRTLPVGASFGVILVRGPSGAGEVEVATFRTDRGYSDGRRPDAVVFSTAEEDAQRRDFTINGMFYDPIDQRVIDYVGGEHDLAEQIVRAIGIPQHRMAEDKLRMLRAIRFAAALEFSLDPATADAVRAMASEIVIVSGERIHQELSRMLSDPHRRRAIELARDVDLLAYVLPELTPILGPNDSDWQHALKMLGLLDEAGFELSLAVLLSMIPQNHTDSVASRLKLSNQQRDHIAWLLDHRHTLDDAANLPMAQLKRLLAKPGIEDLLSLVRVRLLADEADLHPVLFCQDYLESHTREEIDPPPLITGDDLIQAGLTPSRQFKSILESVRDGQLNGELTTKETALEHALRHLQNIDEDHE